MKSNKILAGVLATVLASCGTTTTPTTTAAATSSTITSVAGLNAIQMSGKTKWSDVVALAASTGTAGTLKVAPINMFSVDSSSGDAGLSAVATGLAGAPADAYKLSPAFALKNPVLVLNAAAKVGGTADNVTFEATDLPVAFQGLVLGNGTRVTVTGATAAPAIGAAAQNLSVGDLVVNGQASGGTAIAVTGANTTFIVDTASVMNATLTFSNLQFAYASGLTAGLGTKQVSLGDGAVVISNAAIAIPAGYTLTQTDTSSLTGGTLAGTGAVAITNAGTHTLTKGTVAATTYTNTGTLNQAGGTITATFTNGTAAVTSGTTTAAVMGTHTMTVGLVTGAYSNLAGSVNLSGGAKIDGAFTNNDQLTIAADVSTTSGATTTVTSAATITGAVINTGTLNINGGVLGGALTSTGTSATATAAVAMSGGTVTGAVANNAYSTFTMSGGTLASTLTNIANATFTISGASADVSKTATAAAITATKITGAVTNTGTFIVKGGATGDFKNDTAGVFTFDSTDNAIVGNVTSGTGANTFNFTTGKTLTVTSLTLGATTTTPSVVNVILSDNGGLAAGDTTTTPVALISSTGAIDLKTVVLNLKANNKQPIAAGTKFQLVNAATLTAHSTAVTVDTSLTVNNLAATPTKIAVGDFTITNAANVLTLTVTNGLAAQPASTAKSAIVAGGFRSHATAPKATKIAGTSFAFVNDAALSNGSFDGTFALQSASTFAGFDLTHSVASTSKALTQSSFNDASFMTIVSKDLGSNGFTFAPSVALGVVQAFGVNASAELNNDTFFVKDASNSSLIAELGFTSSTSFKLNGVEFAASAAASVASKSGDQTFNMTNRDGDMMVGQAAKHNVALNLGLSAKIDATTSFYANAKSASYNNSKAIEVGVKF